MQGGHDRTFFLLSTHLSFYGKWLRRRICSVSRRERSTSPSSPLPPQPVAAPHDVLPPFPGFENDATVDLLTLPAPRMKRSALVRNGLRVASQETYGELCNFGIFVDAGSRVESVAAGNRGATQLMELMAFKSTYRRSQMEIRTAVAEMGGTTVAYSARDIVMYNVEVLRECLEPAMELLAESLLVPRFDEAEIDEMRHVMALQAEQLPPDILLKEAAHEVSHTGVRQSVSQSVSQSVGR